MRIQAFSEIKGGWVDTLHDTQPSVKEALAITTRFQCVKWRIVNPKGAVLKQGVAGRVN